MNGIEEKAREIGRLVAQTPEFKAVKEANASLANDRDAVTLVNRLAAMEEEITSGLRAGREPTEEQQKEYETLADRLQQMTAYQRLVAAQTNFERLMNRINDEIGRGLETGEQSRIILP